jgi:hypothetical protein
MASIGTETGEVCGASISHIGAVFNTLATRWENCIFNMQYRVRGERERDLSIPIITSRIRGEAGTWGDRAGVSGVEGLA